MKEIWKWIPGFEGYYQVSDLGRVRSVDRTTVSSCRTKIYTHRGKILKPATERGGYVNVSLSRKSQYSRKKVHRLVLTAFIGPDERPIDHINGNKTDNRLVNLRYCTHRQNSQYMRAGQSNTSRYMGVCWHVRNKKWMASMSHNCKTVHLGYFTSEADAGNAYQEAVRKLDESR